MDKATPQNHHHTKDPKANFKYESSPMLNAFPGNTESCFDQVNQYGTYEIQRTADTANFFPAIAQGLPKDADFKIWTKNLEDLEEE